MPLVSKFMSKRASGAKFGSTSKRFTAIRSGKVDFAAKVTLGLNPHFIMTYSSAEKGKSACMGNCEISIESETGSFPSFVRY